MFFILCVVIFFVFIFIELRLNFGGEGGNVCIFCICICSCFIEEKKFFLINRKWGIWVGLGVIMLNVVDMVKYMNFYFSNMDKNGNEFMIIVNFNVLY